MQELIDMWLAVPNAFKLYIGIAVLTFLGLLGYVLSVFFKWIGEKVRNRPARASVHHAHVLRH